MVIGVFRARSADWVGAEAAVEGGFEAGDEAVGSEGAAVESVAAELVDELFIVVIAQDLAPRVGRPASAPGAGVDEVVRWIGVGAVGGGAGPGVSPRDADHAGADGVALDVTHGGEEVAGIEGAGVEAVLPEVAGAGVHAVDVLGVSQVGTADGLGKGVVVVRRGYEVDMVGHEAVAEHVEGEAGGLLGEGFEVEAAVGVGEEDVLAVVAALDDVVRRAGRDDAGGAGHGGEGTGYGVWCQETGNCPGFPRARARQLLVRQHFAA